MGLASSQARMLLLTARKSDLEYRAQAISQRKINIAMQTEQLATQYSRATSNRVMNLVYFTDGNKQDTLTEKLSYQGIMAENGNIVGSYLVRATNGKYVYTDDASMVSVAKKLAIQDGQKSKFCMTEEKQVYEVPVYEKNESGEYDLDEHGNYKPVYKKDENGDPMKDEETGELIIETEYTTDTSDEKKEYTVVKDKLDGKEVDRKRTVETWNLDSLVAAYASQMVGLPEYANSDVFQSALRNGSLYLYKQNDAEGTYNSVSWSALSCIQDKYDTTDDAAAQADYEAKALVLSNQDKMLDLELNQIETQHKAIETEYDSVKKVIEKNIDTSYKIFA